MNELEVVGWLVDGGVGCKADNARTLKRSSIMMQV